MILEIFLSRPDIQFRQIASIIDNIILYATSAELVELLIGNLGFLEESVSYSYFDYIVEEVSIVMFDISHKHMYT